jgi:hypothetical protein
MTAAVSGAVPLLVAAALFLALGVLGTTRSVPAALGVLLDLLLAAGLLHLLVVDSWPAIGSVALVVLVRKLAMVGIRFGRSTRPVRA